MSNIRTGVLCAASVALFAGAAQADELLIIDLSVTDEITVTATDGLSESTVSGGDTTGIYLADFFTADGEELISSSGTGDFTNFLNPSDGSPGIFRAGTGTDTGLNFWTWSSDSTVDFTAGVQAFTGSATFSLTPAQYADMLAANPTGDIFFPADGGGDLPQPFLGTYSVSVPAPGAVAIMGLGVGAGAARRRR